MQSRSRKIDMTTRRLVMLSAALEVATGFAFVVLPNLVATVLLGSGLSAIGILIIRGTGISLLALGVACWPNEEIVTAQVILTLFTYNLLAAFYFGYLRVGKGFVSYLLWPAFPLHAMLALLLAHQAYESVQREWLGPFYARKSSHKQPRRWVK
jgi:hypothetical protein